jgi:RNA polymerase sigma-70 factor (ECF subfamily)
VQDAGFDELVRRAREADAQALEELVSIYSPRVFGLLYRLTGSGDAAEDLLQETFLRMVRAIGDYEDRGRFEAWLFHIAANLARDYVRRERRRGDTQSFDEAGGGEGRETPGIPVGVGPRAEEPPDRLLRQEAAQRLSECLNRLSQAEREILLLRHYAELSFREIAELLGVPLGTALARAHRALARLREQMGGPPVAADE